MNLIGEPIKMKKRNTGKWVDLDIYSEHGQVGQNFGSSEILQYARVTIAIIGIIILAALWKL